MQHNIAWINTTAPTVDYSVEAIAEYHAGHEDGVEKYTELFELHHAVQGGDDIGGLIVYNDRCVYDYENFVGWQR
jgi:hypothetical protein